MKLIEKILQHKGNSYWCRAAKTLNYYSVYEFIQDHLSFLSIILIATTILFPFPTFAEEADTELKGFKFGLGLTLTRDFPGRNRVAEAEVVNGTVRITKERDDIPRLMLETHYFFVHEATSFFNLVKPRMWGWGPFVGIQSGSEEIIESFAFGFMIGLKRSENSSKSFNIGLGVIVDPSVKVLGDGIKKDEPLPPGETQVRFKETGQWGFLFITSYSF